MSDKIETDSSIPRANRELSLAAAASITTTPDKRGVATTASITAAAKSTMVALSSDVKKTSVAVTPATPATDKTLATSTPTSSVPDIVKVRKCDWDLLVAKVQKLDKQRIAEVHLLASMQDMEKKNKVLEQTVAEYEKAYLRSERNFADILRVQGFAIPTKLTKAAGGRIPVKSPFNSMDLQESKLPYQLPKDKYNDSVIQTDGAARKDTTVLKKDDLKVDVSRNQSGENPTKTTSTEAVVPRIDVLLRESSRPDSWYTSWRMTPNQPQIGVSKSTFESLAQEYAHLQQQMTKLSSQKGFDLKTNLELQESVHQLQMVLEQKDAVIQQLKVKVAKAEATVAKRNTLIEAYSLECARLQAENQKLQTNVSSETHDELQKSASLPSQINTIVADKERLAELQNTVSRLQSEIRELKAAIDSSERKFMDAREKLVWSERRNRDWEDAQKKLQAQIEQVKQENRTLTKTCADLNVMIEDLRKQLAASEELQIPLELQIKLYKEGYDRQEHELKVDQIKHSNLVDMYRKEIAQLTAQLDYYVAQEAKRQQEFHDKLPRSLSAGQCAPEAMRDNEFLRYRPSTIQVDASKKSSPERVTAPVYANKNLPANNPTATSTPRPTAQAYTQQHHDPPDSGIHSTSYSTGGSTSSQSTARQAVPAYTQHHGPPDSGIHSAPYSTGGSTSSQSSISGSTYTCPTCDEEFNDRQKFGEHCLKCVIE